MTRLRSLGLNNKLMLVCCLLLLSNLTRKSIWGINNLDFGSIVTRFSRNQSLRGVRLLVRFLLRYGCNIFGVWSRALATFWQVSHQFSVSYKLILKWFFRHDVSSGHVSCVLNLRVNSTFLMLWHLWAQPFMVQNFDHRVELYLIMALILILVKLLSGYYPLSFDLILK